MTSLSGSEEVLKLDARGRVLISRERREALLEEYERSGMSGPQFARLVGIKYGTFSAWVWKRRQAARRQRQQMSEPSAAISGGAQSVKLIEAVLGEAAGANHANGERCGGTVPGALRVDLPGGCRLWLESPVHLAMAAELVVLVAQAGRTRC
jgi:hypothetical protein